MKQKSLYLECYSGISGDMSVAALLDLGADEAFLRNCLESLNLQGYEFVIGRKLCSGIDACTFDVQIPEQPCYDEGHGMSMEHHEHHEHHHHHAHRNLQDIEEILSRLESTEVRDLAMRIFHIVADAEAQAHNKPLSEIHFHEVGAIDSIVDIVAASACFVSLDIDRVIVSPLYEGVGHLCCQHGMMPVPAPATLNIIEKHGMTLHITENQGEMITPTGAAIAAALKTSVELPETFRVLATGLGAGKKTFRTANLLRAMLIES